MLEALSIQGVVLIDRLELKFNSGFTVLTGETGAGKSILLDALGLALGERANTQLINPRHTSANVSALFSLNEGHPVRSLMNEHDLGSDDTVILRRILTNDGKSRAYINDQSVSLGLLKEIGSRLVEIHGQFDHLLDPKSHLSALDRFARLEVLRQQTADAFQTLRTARKNLKEHEEKQSRAHDDREFLSHAIDELRALALKADEEQTLKAEREFLANHTKIIEHLQTTFHKLYAEKGAENLLREAGRTADKVSELSPGRFNEISSGIERAIMEIEELRNSLSQGLEQDDFEGKRLEEVEERLFNLRTVARKHGVTVEALPELLEKFEADFNLVASQNDVLASLRKAVEGTRTAFLNTAQELRVQRLQAQQHLEQAIKQELIPLKLDKAEVKIEIQELDENSWNENGIDSVEFKIQPNPGMPLGSLTKIASGGERSRFMLALKVILANDPDLSLLIFDEIDAGVGGAVASAIGERMARLGSNLQVLAITHAPQVAAWANGHWVVSKRTQDDMTVTDVKPLADNERLEEVARMLAGEHITPEARAAAAQLLNLSKGAAA